MWSVAVSILFIALILVALFFAVSHEQVQWLLQWIEQRGAWAPLIFILVMALVVVLVLPGVMFTLGAGFVFGVVEGTIYVVVGTTLGATLAFLIGRYLFGATARRFILTHAKLRLMNEELEPQGWKIVLLTQLVPFFPSKLCNYFFGLTALSLRGFVGGTFVGIIAFSLHNVYLGSIAADIATKGERHAERTAIEWVVYGGGLVAIVVAVAYLSRLARRALAKYMAQDGDTDTRCRG